MISRRTWALPLVPLYAAALAAKDSLRASGMLRIDKLKWPVISVGSLSAGGAGKTPVVIALAQLLQAQSWNVDVLSRGYGRQETGVAQVLADSPDAATRFGDEPVLIARHAHVPVWVADQRFAAGLAAEGSSPSRPLSLHLLDDGFQHRQLARTLDIVLVTAADLDDALLPAGNRREPLSALRRAHILIFREEERADLEPRLRNLSLAQLKIWAIQRRLMLPVPADQLSSGPHPLAFCAIARPEGFWSMLQQAGIAPIRKLIFPDHHAYNAADIDKLLEIARNSSATGFVTTSKDHVKLSPAMIDRLQTIGPLDALNLEVKFVDEAAVIRDLEARLP